jgi:hypothetical protein
MLQEIIVCRNEHLIVGLIRMMQDSDLIKIPRNQKCSAVLIISITDSLSYKYR